MEKIVIDEYFLTDDALNDFLLATRNIPTATKEENIELKKLMAAGLEDTSDIMFYKNLRLVTSIILKKSYHPRSSQKVDLLQEGFIGLLRAIDQFDSEKGAFSNYAMSKIKSAIQRYLRDIDPFISRPSNYQEHERKYQQIKRKCTMQGIPLPDDDELRKQIGITERELNQIKIDFLLEPDSIEVLFEDDKEQTTSKRQIDNLIESITFKDLLGIIKLKFTPYEYYILYRKYIDDVTFETIGKEFNVERQTIQKRISKMIKKIRAFFDKNRNLIISFSSLTTISRDNFKLEPVSPENVTTYLFVKDYITIEERELLREFVFTDDRRQSIPQELKEKIEQYMKDNYSCYLIFHKQIIENHGVGIYDIALGKLVIPAKDGDKNLEMQPAKVQKK